MFRGASIQRKVHNIYCDTDIAAREKAILEKHGFKYKSNQKTRLCWYKRFLTFIAEWVFREVVYFIGTAIKIDR